MKQIILGTAGHIDHGKSSLVKALTGVDPDRLKEEKKRGITIELGFASLGLPDGSDLGVIDVPGHEKFIKNMVAGASGIDMVALVVAADEGVMPQTREHLEICLLLGIKYGFVVLTKTDLVDEDLLELAKDDVRELIAGSFLEDAPILPVSSVTGEGLDLFAQVVAEIAAEIPERTETGLLRLPVDRVFSMKGFGTVITGTLISGEVATGDMVEVYPAGICSKVRGVQVHGETVSSAAAGMRTAINFQGIEKSKIARGHVVGAPQTLMPSYMLDVDFSYLLNNAKPLKNRALVRVHAGTSEILGNLILLDREELAPGDNAAVQLRLKEPVVCLRDDNIVIRSYSPLRTIGGGRVINPVPQKHKRYKIEHLPSIMQGDDGSLLDLIEAFCAQAKSEGVSFAALRVMTCASETGLKKAIDSLLSKQAVVLIDKDRQTYVHGTVLDQISSGLVEFLEAFHKSNPLKKGVSRQEIKSRMSYRAGDKLTERVVRQLIKSQKLVQEEDVIRLFEHKVELQTDHSEMRKKILELYSEAGLSPPYFKDVHGRPGIKDHGQAKDILMVLLEEGALVKVKDDLYFDGQAVRGLEERLVDYLKANGEISTPEFKEMTKTSRKYTIPLLEYFDARKLTLRIGDIRKLRA